MLAKNFFQKENLTIEITSPFSKKLHDQDLEYKISVSIQYNGVKKNYAIVRVFREFENLHEEYMKISRFTPFFPAKNIFKLSEQELKERLQSLINYFNKAFLIPQILASSATWEFFEIAQHGSIYFNMFQTCLTTEEFPYQIQAFEIINNETAFVIVGEAPSEFPTINNILSALNLFNKSKTSSKIPSRLIQLKFSNEFKNMLVELNQELPGCFGSMSIDQNDKRIYIGSEDGEIIGFNLIDSVNASGELVKVFSCHFHAQVIIDLKICPGSRKIFSIGKDMKVISSSTNDSKGTQMGSKNLKHEPSILTVDSTNKRVLVGDANGGIQMISIEGFEMLHYLQTSTYKPVTSIELEQKSRYIFVGMADGVCDCYDMPQMNKEKNILLRGSYISTNEIKGISVDVMGKEIKLIGANGVLNALDTHTAEAKFSFKVTSDKPIKTVSMTKEFWIIVLNQEIKICFLNKFYLSTDKMQTKIFDINQSTSTSSKSDPFLFNKKTSPSNATEKVVNENQAPKPSQNQQRKAKKLDSSDESDSDNENGKKTTSVVHRNNFSSGGMIKKEETKQNEDDDELEGWDDQHPFIVNLYCLYNFHNENQHIYITQQQEHSAVLNFIPKKHKIIAWYQNIYSNFGIKNLLNQ